jgi:glutathione S-transferase
MTPILYAHPFSSYCQKAITALYEHDVAFTLRLLDGSEPVAGEFARLWPLGRFPVMTAGGRTIVEATAIVEHVDLHHARTHRLIPVDGDAAVEVRMLDRFFDNYVNTPQQRIVLATLGREPGGEALVAQMRAALDTAYAWLEERMATRDWAAAEQFSMADCAAAPALLYADWTHAIAPRFRAVHAYRARLLARPSYARALDEARPYRALFPLGAPTDRD